MLALQTLIVPIGSTKPRHASQITDLFRKMKRSTYVMKFPKRYRKKMKIPLTSRVGSFGEYFEMMASLNFTPRKFHTTIACRQHSVPIS